VIFVAVSVTILGGDIGGDIGHITGSACATTHLHSGEQRSVWAGWSVTFIDCFIGGIHSFCLLDRCSAERSRIGKRTGRGMDEQWQWQ
jgi:hypothetical protein